MRAILLGAGQGTRLRPLTDDRPKCMVEVGGRPLLDWQIRALRAAGVDDIVLVRGYSRSRIQAPNTTRYSHRDSVCLFFERSPAVDATACPVDFGPCRMQKATT